MAIYQYDGSQKTPKNYIGFRVAVSVNGELRQKWFKKTETIPKEAKALEKQWKFEQQLYKASRKTERKELSKNSAYVTGVAGIKMKFEGGVKGKQYSTNITTHRYYPVFIVSGTVDGNRFIKRFNIKTLGYDMAWFKACHFASTKYGETILDKILAKKPSVKQFHIIYRWQTKCGHDISLKCLPDELACD
jgi:hypothetical protein